APLQRCSLSILAADDSGRCLGANEAVCTLTGYSESELLGMQIRDLSVARHLERDQRAWQHFLRGAGFVGEYQLRRKSGDPIAIPCVAVAHVIPGLHVATMWRYERMTVVG
ncbi:MAG: PAS domain-containing protein, partial [Acidobacteriota bacterium]